MVRVSFMLIDTELRRLLVTRDTHIAAVMARLVGSDSTTIQSVMASRMLLLRLATNGGIVAAVVNPVIARKVSCELHGGGRFRELKGYAVIVEGGYGEVASVVARLKGQNVVSVSAKEPIEGATLACKLPFDIDSVDISTPSRLSDESGGIYVVSGSTTVVGQGMAQCSFSKAFTEAFMFAPKQAGNGYVINTPPLDPESYGRIIGGLAGFSHVFEQGTLVALKAKKTSGEPVVSVDPCSIVAAIACGAHSWVTSALYDFCISCLSGQRDRLKLQRQQVVAETILRHACTGGWSLVESHIASCLSGQTPLPETSFTSAGASTSGFGCINLARSLQQGCPTSWDELSEIPIQIPPSDLAGCRLLEPQEVSKLIGFINSMRNRRDPKRVLAEKLLAVAAVKATPIFVEQVNTHGGVVETFYNVLVDAAPAEAARVLWELVLASANAGEKLVKRLNILKRYSSVIAEKGGSIEDNPFVALAYALRQVSQSTPHSYGFVKSLIKISDKLVENTQGGKGSEKAWGESEELAAAAAVALLSAHLLRRESREDVLNIAERAAANVMLWSLRRAGSGGPRSLRAILRSLNSSSGATQRGYGPYGYRHYGGLGLQP